MNGITKKTSWTWIPTQALLKSGDQFTDLRSTISPLNSNNVTLRIDTERELQQSPELGWNWHKSWNIPNISVKLCLVSGDQIQDASWPQCEVRISAAKHLQGDVYDEIGLDGPVVQELVDGKAFFAGVKFNSTTYNHQGHKFNLILTVRTQGEIVVAVMSPQVFVDSRKSARDEHRQIQYIQPFDPKYLERSFCKKEKHSNDVIDAPIENNETGLHNYLTAPNIRNKIKHPLFLAIKFSKCFYIYYKKSNQQSTTELIKDFQTKLINKEETEFIIGFQSNNNRIKRKIEESLTNLFIQSKIKVIEKKHIDEENYQRLEAIEEAYALCYPDLMDMMTKKQPQDNEPQIQKKIHLFEKLPTTQFGEQPESNIKVEDEAQPDQCQAQFLLLAKENYLRYFFYQQQLFFQLLQLQQRTC